MSSSFDTHEVVLACSGLLHLVLRGLQKIVLVENQYSAIHPPH
jgi:hypothetical protein